MQINFQARRELSVRRKKLRDKESAREEWNRYRRSVKSDPIVDALRAMNGLRQRCVYCCDSRSADVDHFVPIAADFHVALTWTNFILVCPECNRKKSARFPLDAQGSPLLLDPTLEDPWEYLILDTKTGYLSARFLENDFDPKGEATVDVISCVNHEAVVEGRRRVIARYYEAVDALLAANGRSDALGKLVREVREDEYGISAWFAFREGGAEDRFFRLKSVHAHAWRRFVKESFRSQLPAAS